MSVLLWGPPGTGKTTLAYVVSRVTSRRFIELSAVSAGVKDVRAAIETARGQLGLTGEQTVLFIDEVHRFNKAQQDALLPAVENRWVSFIGATTENPSFSVVGPLLSRSLLLTLRPLSDEDMRTVIDRALTDERGLAGAVTLADGVEAHLIRLAGGDARRALTYLEAAALGLPAGGQITARGPGTRRRPGHGPLRPGRRPALRRDQRVHQEHARQRPGRGRALPGQDDRGGRGPALHRAAADRARQRGRRHGRPDRACRSRSRPPRRSSSSDCPRPGSTWPRRSSTLPWRPSPTRCAGHLVRRDRRPAGPGRAGAQAPAGRAATPARPGWATARATCYPHDDPAGVVRQQYAPDGLVGKRYYEPTTHGAEARYAERSERIRAILDGTADGHDEGNGDAPAAADHVS